MLCEDIARAVDGSAKRRLGNASRIAERLRALDERRVNLEAKRRAEAEAEQAKIALQRAHRRRKVMLSAMAVLIVFAITMAIQAQRIAREAERANREAQAAEQVAAFLVDLFAVSDPGEARGNTITAREILDRGAAKIAGELAIFSAPRSRISPPTAQPIARAAAQSDRASRVGTSPLIMPQHSASAWSRRTGAESRRSPPLEPRAQTRGAVVE